MRYADFYECDICNGKEIGVSLFVQGCPFHCKGCFNQETWDFNGGKEWTAETERKFFNLIGREYIHRITFLGGSPLCNQNIDAVYHIIKKIKKIYPTKHIWVYTGMIWENILERIKQYEEDVSLDYETFCLKEILNMIDVLVDGPFEYDKRDLTLAFRGSSNQRIIDVQSSLKTKEVILKNIDD